MVTNKVTDWSQTNCIISTCSILITKVERVFDRICIITKNVYYIVLPKLDMRGCSFCVAFLSTIYTKVNVHLITYNRLWIKRFRIIDKYKQFNVLFHVINEGIGCRKKLIAVFTRIYYAMQATFNMFFTLRPWGELSIWLNICINVSLLIW